MKKLHFGILLVTLLLIVGGLLGYTLVKNGTFPVAKVNGKVIFLSSVQENVEASQRIYQSSPELLEDESLSSLFFGGASGELFHKTFESFIINTIINTSVDDNVKDRAEARIDQELSTADVDSLRASVELLYEWNLDKFRDRILAPQAIEEIVATDLGDKYGAWLNSTIASADVSIWFLPFEWGEGKLKGK